LHNNNPRRNNEIIKIDKEKLRIKRGRKEAPCEKKSYKLALA
jgi:energy-converting hydrogenase A subunit M